MRSVSVASALLLTLAVLVPTAVADHDATEPVYAGVLSEGESALHHHDGGEACGRSSASSITVLYGIFVTLEYAPATDRLDLSAAGETVRGEAGIAVIQFVSPWGVCRGMDIVVSGVDVLAEAAYTVQVAVVPFFFLDYDSGNCTPPLDVPACVDEYEAFVDGVPGRAEEAVDAVPCDTHGAVEDLFEECDRKGPKS